MTGSIFEDDASPSTDRAEPRATAGSGRRSRRGVFLALGGAVLLAACGRKPATLLPPGRETEDEFPTRYPRY